MAQFIGCVKGTRGEASRLGTKKSGLTCIAASWLGAVSVSLRHDEKGDTDIAVVRLIPWRGAGVHLDLYDGPVGGPKGGKKSRP